MTPAGMVGFCGDSPWRSIAAKIAADEWQDMALSIIDNGGEGWNEMRKAEEWRAFAHSKPPRLADNPLSSQVAMDGHRSVGRPKISKEKYKGELLTLRTTMHERRAFDIAAKLQGVGLSKWARMALKAMSGPTNGWERK